MFVYKWPQKIVIYLVLTALLLSSFGLGQIRHAQAATTFTTPGKWYVNTKGDLINEISVTRNGVPTTVNYTYYKYGAQGTFIYKKTLADEVINNVTAYKLANSECYAFVNNTTNKVFEIGQLSTNTFGIDFRFREGGVTDGRTIGFIRGTSDITSETGQYVKAESAAVKTSQQTVLSATSTGIPPEVKAACKNLLIKPFSDMNPNPFTTGVLKPLNDKLGDVKMKLSAAEDKDLYAKFFKTPGSDISDTRLDIVGKYAYADFVGEYQKVQTAWNWMWDDPKTAGDFNKIISAVMNFKPVTSTLTIAWAALDGLVNWPIDIMKQKSNDQAWLALTKLLAAKAYLEAHIQYDECIAGKMPNPPFDVAKEKANLAAILKLTAAQQQQITATQAAANAANQVNLSAGENMCEKFQNQGPLGGVSNLIQGIINPLGYLICALIDNIKDAVTWIMTSEYGLGSSSPNVPW